jgi:hypothetical protein
MYRLIHDLLDTAAIEAGHSQLARSPTTVYELLIDAIRAENEPARGSCFAFTFPVARTGRCPMTMGGDWPSSFWGRVLTYTG